MAPAAAWVILIALVLLILLNISMLIHSIAKAPCCKYTTSCGQLLQKVLRSGRVRKEDDPMLRHVYKKMFHVWVCRARVVAWYGAVFTSLSNLPVLLMHGLTRGEDGTLQSANFRGQDLIVLLFLALTTLLARCPRLVTGRSLGALYVLFFALLVAFWLCREANNRIFQLISILFLNRLTITWIYNSIGVTVGCNAIWFLVVLLRPPLEVQESIDDDVSTRIFTMQTFVVAELVFFVTLVVVCFGWRRSLWAGFWMEAQARSFDSETAAVGELLHATCDVVVELKEDLTFAGESPRFNALMMLGGKQRVANANILQFIPQADDKQRLQDCLSAAWTDRMSIAGALHVQMRDSIGNSFDMELFHVSFEGFDGSVKHLVGMREFADMPVPPLRSERGVFIPDWREDRPLHSTEPLAAADPATEARTALAVSPAIATATTSTATATATAPKPGPRPGPIPEIMSATRAPSMMMIPYLNGKEDPRFVTTSRENLGDRDKAGAGEGPIDWGPLVDESSNCSSSAVEDIFGAGFSRILPHFKKTSEQAMAISLLHTLMTWNFEVPESTTCCPMHAALLAGKKQLAGLAARPCSSSEYWEAICDFDQCVTCGLLGDLEDWGGPKCFVCRSNSQIESL